jgi:hypothetical protein
MKKLLILTALVSLFACEKRNQKSYKLENWSELQLSVSTPESTYLIPGKSSKKIASSGNYSNFTYFYAQHYARVDTKNEHPIRTVMVIAYTHKLSVMVTGQADSAYTIINGNHKKVKLPYYWGTNSNTNYNVIVTPVGANSVYTQIRINDRKVDEFYHEYGEIGKLTGE